MNIPQIYLVEPYNAYAPKGKKKHWHQVVEEEALMARIIAEQQARQQAEQQLIQEAKSKTLPPQAPPESLPPIVGNTAGAGSEGAAGSAPGGGGMPVWDFFHASTDVVNFNRSPATGAGPLTVTFTNFTTTPQFDSYRWEFTQEGVTVTSTDVNPTIVFQTGSTNPTVITASLQVTNSVTGEPGGRSPDVYTLVSIPTLNVSFTVTSSSIYSPSLVTLTPTVTYNGAGILSGQWRTGEWAESGGEYTLPTITTWTNRSYDTRSGVAKTDGKFTASLQVTESSYGIKASYTQSFALLFPSIVPSFTVGSSSNSAPSVVTLTDTSVNNGAGTITGNWRAGEFNESGNEYTLPRAGSPTFPRTYDTRSDSAGTTIGEFTASLGLTGSNYGVMAYATQSFYITASLPYTG
jgi:hypothetical protein